MQRNVTAVSVVLGVGLEAVLAGLLLGACSPQVAAPEPIRSVRIQVVAAAGAVSAQEFAAEVRPRSELRLSFRVPGRLTQRPVQVGQVVRAGQVVAQLDAADLKLGQASAQAAAQAAKANTDVAEAEIKRYRELREQGFISALDLDRREAALSAQRAQLAQAQAQLAVQGNQAGYATLTAPTAGVVTAVEAEPGTVLPAGATVVRVAPDGARDAVFSVPEDSVQAWSALQGVAGALRVKPWGTGSVATATVREISAAADPATRTFLIKAELALPDAKLGQTLTVRLERSVPAGVMQLPLTAVTQKQGKTAVWVLDRSTMTVQLQPVELAGSVGNQVVVAQGLSAGQTVVTAGVHTLTPGQKVTLFVEAGNAAAAAAAAAVGVSPR